MCGNRAAVEGLCFQCLFYCPLHRSRLLPVKGLQASAILSARNANTRPFLLWSIGMSRELVNV